jgi:hypothetical protein
VLGIYVLTLHNAFVDIHQTKFLLYVDCQSSSHIVNE